MHINLSYNVKNNRDMSNSDNVGAFIKQQNLERLELEGVSEVK